MVGLILVCVCLCVMVCMGLTDQAIKIFSKSLLTRRRQYMRTGEGKMSVTTDMDKVQKEIAIMKKLIHPNLVRLYEVSRE